MSKFTPNAKSFLQCQQRIANVLSDYDKKIGDEIITSKDPEIQAIVKDLEVTNVPDGFVKYHLPIVFEEPTQMFLSFSAPRIKVPTHSHDEGAGIRVIISGSIDYEGQTLFEGDWMYIPAGKAYSFEVGDMGASFCYCYACCCG